MFDLNTNNSLTEYTYNDKGLKYSKTSYSGGLFSVETEQLFYVYDAGGAEVATYKKLVQIPNDVYALQHHTLYGAGRVGLLDKSTGKALFELSDHLGNVRAVVTDNGSGVAETVSYTDYYPHGGVLPGRNYQSSLNFPYGYQGQEKDAATGLTNFELRQYDPRIGRWYNPDPYGQHHSPYLAMSNNPVSFTDPDGGWDASYGADDAQRDAWFAYSGGAQNAFINGDADSYLNGLENMAMVKHAYNDYRARHTNENGQWGNYIYGQNATKDGDMHQRFEIDESVKIDNSIFGRSSFGNIKPPASGIYYVFEKYTPNIYRNISGFLKERPDWQYLHYAGGGKEGLAIQNRNRKVIDQILPAAPNIFISRDEFPMASTLEGGDVRTLKVRYVPAIENSVQGGQLSWVYRGLSRGATIKVVPVPKGAEGSPVYRPNPILDVTPIVVPIIIKGVIKILTSPKPILITPGFIPTIPILNDDKLDLKGSGGA